MGNRIALACWLLTAILILCGVAGAGVMKSQQGGGNFSMNLAGKGPLDVDSVDMGTMGLTALTAAPASPILGNIYKAAVASWDPASIGGSNNYWVMYVGSSTYAPLFDEAGHIYLQDKEKLISGTTGFPSTCSTSQSIDPTTGTEFSQTLNGACAYDIANLATGQSFILFMSQTSTTAPTFSSKFVWQNGTTPTFSTTTHKDTVFCAAMPDGAHVLCSASVGN